MSIEGSPRIKKDGDAAVLDPEGRAKLEQQETARIIALAAKLERGVSCLVLDEATGEFKEELTEKGLELERLRQESLQRMNESMELGYSPDQARYIESTRNLFERIHRGKTDSNIIAAGIQVAKNFIAFLSTDDGSKKFANKKEAWEDFLQRTTDLPGFTLTQEQRRSLWKDAASELSRR